MESRVPDTRHVPPPVEPEGGGAGCAAGAALTLLAALAATAFVASPALRDEVRRLVPGAERNVVRVVTPDGARPPADTTATLAMTQPSGGAGAAVAPPAGSAPPAEPIRMGPVDPPRLVSRVEPLYPEMARRARVQGVVIVETIVDRHGDVRSARVLEGLPMGLDDAALDAVRQWRFTPATMDGRPVEVYYTVTVAFRVQ